MRPAGSSLACSLVSSPGLKSVAEHYGLDFHTTLTGFKWISRAPGIVFGFEEALGYLVNPETVRDKDGISAAIAMLGMVTEARGRGESLARVLAEFDATFGFFASDQISVRVEDVSTIGRIMAALRERHPSVDRQCRRSSGSTTCSRASTTCPPATCCACGWRTGRG